MKKDQLTDNKVDWLLNASFEVQEKFFVDIDFDYADGNQEYLCKFVDNDLIDLELHDIANWIEVSEKRYVELDSGAKPTEDEYEKYYQLRLKEFAHDGDIAGYYTVQIEYEGQTLFVFYSASGYSFSGVDYEFEGVFRTTSEGIDHLFSDGVLFDELGNPTKV